MTEENMNKVYWIVACLVIVVAIGLFLIKPSYDKIDNAGKKIGTDINVTTKDMTTPKE